MIFKPIRTCHLGKLLGRATPVCPDFRYVQNSSIAITKTQAAESRQHSPMLAEQRGLPGEDDFRFFLGRQGASFPVPQHLPRTHRLAPNGTHFSLSEPLGSNHPL